MPQPYIFPANLFEEAMPPAPGAWSCARTKPRAEKKLADWLSAHRMEFYLPTWERETSSHRRVRRSFLPIFPGYVFARGTPTKSEWRSAPGLVDFLPASETQQQRLPIELWQLWRGLLAGSPLEITHELLPGESVEVVAGSLKGLRGSFLRWGKRGKLLLWVDLLSAGAAIEIEESCVARSL